MTRFGASNVQIGCSLRSELNWTSVEGMSSPPLKSTAIERGFSSGRFIHQRARVGPRPWSRTASSSAAGASSWQPGHPVAARDSPRRMNLAVVPSITSGSPSSNAWPARPRQARPRHILHPTTLRALQGVPSGVGVSALFPEHSSTATHGAAVLLKTGADFPIGYTTTMAIATSSATHVPFFQPESFTEATE